MNKAVERAVEQQLRVFEDKSNFLIRRYDSYISAAAEVYEEVKGRPMSIAMKRNLAVTLDNTRELIEKQRFMEQTYTSDVAYTNYAFDIVSVVLPSLIAEEIVSVQAMDRRTAQIFFMNILVDRAKGSFAAGDTLHSSKTGWVSNTFFASNKVVAEDVGDGDGADTTWNGTLAYQNLLSATLVRIYTDEATPKVLSGTMTAGTATLTGSGTGSCSSAGVYSVVFSVAPASGANILVDYFVDLEVETEAIGKIKAEIASETITAKTLKLNSEWLMDAAYDLLKAHGRDAEKEILIALTGEVKSEIDASIILDLYNNATGTAVSWDKSPPASSVPWIWHKNTIIDAMIEQSTNIYTGTRRAVGNFVILGTQVANVVQSLDQFESSMSANQEIVGAYFAGTLSKKWKVYVSPDIPAAKWVMGYMGDSYLKTGYVYAPYLPLFTTPTYTTQDFISHKGLGSSYGTHLVNAKMYSVGTMSNPSYAF